MAARRLSPLKKSASASGRRSRSNPPQGEKRGPPEGGVGVGSEEGGRESGTPAGLASSGVIATRSPRDTPFASVLPLCYSLPRGRYTGFLRRVVMHVDLDAFYASVEQLRRPELRGKPVIVGGSGVPGERGGGAAASSEAPAFWARAAVPLCPAPRV